MTVRLNRILTPEEFRDMNEDAVERGFWRNDARIFKPGWMWTAPWYYDPTGEYEKQGNDVMIPREMKGELGFLSRFYWEDWADKRAPIYVVCPNGEQWGVDQKSSNGEGWKVTGEGLLITVRPSINVYGYHGWLTDGVFSEDLEGRGPIGHARPITERVIK